MTPFKKTSGLFLTQLAHYEVFSTTLCFLLLVDDLDNSFDCPVLSHNLSRTVRQTRSQFQPKQDFTVPCCPVLSSELSGIARPRYRHLWTCEGQNIEVVPKPKKAAILYWFEFFGDHSRRNDSNLYPAYRTVLSRAVPRCPSFKLIDLLNPKL